MSDGRSVICQRDIVRVLMLENRRRLLRHELKLLEEELKTQKTRLVDCLISGAEVEEGFHAAWLNHAVKVRVA